MCGLSPVTSAVLPMLSQLRLLPCLPPSLCSGVSPPLAVLESLQALASEMASPSLQPGWSVSQVWSSWDFRRCLWDVHPLVPFEHSDLDCCCCPRKRKGLRHRPGREALAHDDLSLILRTRKAGQARCGDRGRWIWVSLVYRGVPGPAGLC